MSKQPEGNVWNCWPCWPRLCHCGHPKPLPVTLPESKRSRQRRQKPGRDYPGPWEE
jgi:hypothetical protein